MTALVRGDVQVAVMPAISVMPHAQSGAVKILAVTTAKRSQFLPDVPTLKESGIDVEADAWNGLIAPAGTPPAVLAKIHREVVEAIQSPELKAKFATQLMEPVGNSPARVQGADRQRSRALDAGDPGGGDQGELRRVLIKVQERPLSG